MNKQLNIQSIRYRVIQLTLLLLALSTASIQQVAANESSTIHHQNPDKPKYYTRTEQRYAVPDMTLINQYGKKVAATEILGNDQPVLLQFVFTTCATICPVLSATFSAAQQTLKTMTENYRMVSISIDPEQDTTQTLKDYASRFKASAQWQLLTGSREQVAQIQRAFDAYYPGNNKMYHLPYTYLRAAGADRWVRLDGLLSTQDLIEEYRRLISARQAEQDNAQ